jgi:inositol-phosphate phosphatase / L-galactose 1-phosphate phosphatase / histidinol-phosphatase
MTDGVSPELIGFAAELADASGAVIRRHFRQPLTIEDKPDSSPVTNADKETETVLRALIGRRHPGHGVIGEEYAAHQPDADYLWVIDPIDGTKSFIVGKPLFGTLIALLHKGRPILGVIDHPALGERWIGARGHPTTFNGSAVKVRPCASLKQAVLYASTPHAFEGKDLTRYERIRRTAKLTGYGADCYAYGLVASGFIDLVVETDMAPHDYLALIPVIEGAGGKVTDWAGRPLDLKSDGTVLAAGDERVWAAARAEMTA